MHTIQFEHREQFQLHAVNAAIVKETMHTLKFSFGGISGFLVNLQNNCNNKNVVIFAEAEDFDEIENHDKHILLSM